MNQNKESFALSDSDLENVAGGDIKDFQRPTLLGLLGDQKKAGKEKEDIRKMIPDLLQTYGWMMPNVTYQDLSDFLDAEFDNV